MARRSRPTRAWYLIAVILPVIGGIVGYFAVKNDDQDMANNLLIASILVAFLVFVLIPFMLGFMVGFTGV